MNERFESSLPLIPGVVRGPDGHVNLKGTRNTQSGALVNSANVTDPVTGSPAINLPIDVVASVQVIQTLTAAYVRWVLHVTIAFASIRVHRDRCC